MKSFKQVIEESKSNIVRIYHGDNHNTKIIDPKLMMTEKSNNQEGIGIYFGDLKTAEAYGKNILYCDVDKTKFFNARDIARDEREIVKNLPKILVELLKIDREAMFYMASDYIELTEPEDVENYHMRELSDFLLDNEIRNLQIELSETFDVVNFVKFWNKFIPKNLGTFESVSNFYAIINPKVKLFQYKEE